MTKEEVIISVEVAEKGKTVAAETKDVNTLSTSIEGLSKANKELREERKRLDTATDEGRNRIQAINKEIDKNNKVIKENSSALEKQRLNVGNYTDSIDKSVPAIGAAKTALEGMLNPLTAALSIGTALVAMYAKSTRGARDLAIAQDQLGYATQFVADSFADLVSDDEGMGFFQTLLTGALNYIDPTIAAMSALGAAAKDRLRDLEISAAFAQAFAKDSERQAEVNRRIRDDENASYAERLQAIQAINSELQSSADRTIGVLMAQIAAIKESTIGYDQNRDAQLRVAQLEAEIADKREEINGKLTENVMAERAMRKTFEEERKASDAERIKREDEEAALYFKRIENELSSDLYALEQRKAFEEEFYGDGGQIDQIKKEFDKRIVKDTAARVASTKKLEEESVNHAIQMQQLKQRTAIAGIGFAKSIFGENQLIASAEGAINTFAAANAALKNPPGPPYTIPFMLLTVAQGLANVANINGIALAGGGDFYTKGPTMLMVGDNPGGVERVTVEPISGKGVTRQFSSNMFAMAGGGSLTTSSITAGVEDAANAQRSMQRLIEQVNSTQVVLVREDYEVKQNEFESTQRRARVIG